MRGLKSSRKNAVPTSVSDTICYCDGEREIGTMELFCSGCNKWFHGRCLKDLKDFYGLSFMVCYVFHCKDCSPTSMETWVAKQANFSHMCVTVLANLTAEKLKQDGFQKTGEHVYFKSVHTLHAVLIVRFFLYSMNIQVNPEDENSFALMETNLADIGPVNEFVKQIGKKNNSGEKNNLASTLVGAQQGMGRSSGADSDVDGGPKTRGASKRRNVDSIGTGKKPKLPSYLALSSYFLCSATDYSSSKIAAADGSGPIDFPFNKEGYRYFLVERDPNVVDK
ncbi:hypothetical protein ANCCEY_05906 [Ancylostoma ceylanicum]|uniref:Zinc finger PHD-type domain-containing protein n=1 Tax=Ancylostoma ceylanicum TaxID=53326 RepID=A0A0D6M512_9BILA|nr:hypothetical protein ANCCEY_05906 [Ancylostoma ceylanicum]